MGSGLARLSGYPFEVRYSNGALDRARASASITAEAYTYFGRLLSGVEPDIAVIVADESDWESRQPYGLPYFNDDEDQIRPGILVMSSGRGDFWSEMGEDLLEGSSPDREILLATYPDGDGGLDLQPFFDLVTIHELGHAFEAFGDLRLPTFWLSEIFANLCLHAYVATKRPDSLDTLEVLSKVGARSTHLDARFRKEGYHTLEQLEAHYTGGDDPMSPRNYVWYQYQWQRLAAAMFDAEGEAVLVRWWKYFRTSDHHVAGDVTAATLAPMLATEVSEILGRTVREWR
jgi:hypothetical protein